ncbi:hypothetical protein BJY01DRAFT_146273 [Aspergillus pseudoustus]|uniref:Uncharacterized protein n=1 Tax=Aspergillus pseudoustus TaxID=1810923 RepID=A0ABR4KA89_9EURO
MPVSHQSHYGSFCGPPRWCGVSLPKCSYGLSPESQSKYTSTYNTDGKHGIMSKAADNRYLLLNLEQGNSRICQAPKEMGIHITSESDNPLPPPPPFTSIQLRRIQRYTPQQSPFWQYKRLMGSRSCFSVRILPYDDGLARGCIAAWGLLTEDESTIPALAPGG